MIRIASSVQFPPVNFVMALQHAPLYLWFDVQNAAGPFQAEVTSWFRTPERNAAVGGHPESQHLVGTALDVVTPNPRDWPQIAARLRWAKGIVESDHLHVQLYPAGVGITSWLRSMFV